MNTHAQILVVEDDPDSISTTAYRLEHELRCAVTVARTLDEALKYLSGTLFDALIVDVRIPRSVGEGWAEFGGIELIAMLHRDFENPNVSTPYIFLTAQKRSLSGGEAIADKRCLGVVKKLTQDEAIAIVGELLAKR